MQREEAEQQIWGVSDSNNFPTNVYQGHSAWASCSQSHSLRNCDWHHGKIWHEPTTGGRKNLHVLRIDFDPSSRTARVKWTRLDGPSRGWRHSPPHMNSSTPGQMWMSLILQGGGVQLPMASSSPGRKDLQELLFSFHSSDLDPTEGGQLLYGVHG